MAAPYDIEITDALLSTHGLSSNEYAEVVRELGRKPNLVELGVFSAMWSEHCSYKSTRAHLSTLHTTGDCVVQGPGENAGVIDVGDGDVCVFKMESHNHPSFIEPFSGAATGVGGILRDIFTMGARPIANLNSLRFGLPNFEATPRILQGVTSGIGYYGNCVGVPMLAGECTFDESYNTNPIVNAMSVGVCKRDALFFSSAGVVGEKIMYFGNKTGRDGIHGASMSSSEFEEGHDEAASKPAVQVGDAFAGKLLLEACLKVMQAGCVSSIQDMGAAGLTCSLAEMAHKGQTGVRVDLGRVPVRFSDMNAYEIMLSESQERMLMTVKDGMETEAQRIFEKYCIDYAVLGEVTTSGKMELFEDGKIVCDISVSSLTDKAPILKHPYELHTNYSTNSAEPLNCPREDDFAADAFVGPQGGLLFTLAKVLQHPDVACKQFFWEKYDTGVGNRTIHGLGESAGLAAFGEVFDVAFSTKDVLQLAPRFAKLAENYGKTDNTNNDGGAGPKGGIVHYKSRKALALSCDCVPRYVYADAKLGAMQAVSETYRNISATGARPLAITNCLNFASPEKPKVMGQVVGAIQGITEACKRLDLPVVSGNVSLYNATGSKDIKPTPTIGGVGLIGDYMRACSIGFKAEEDAVFILGNIEGHVENSIYLRQTLGVSGGRPPAVDLELELLHGNFVRDAIKNGLVNACGDVSNGGVLTTIARMAIHSVDISLYSDGPEDMSFLGAYIETAKLPSQGSNVEHILFGEDQGVYVLGVSKHLIPLFVEYAAEHGVVICQVGYVCPDVLAIDYDSHTNITNLVKAYFSLRQVFSSDSDNGSTRK